LGHLAESRVLRHVIRLILGEHKRRAARHAHVLVKLIGIERGNFFGLFLPLFLPRLLSFFFLCLC
jgi:hypothetical protein